MNVDPFVRAATPDPAWWDEPHLRAALSERDIGQVFHQLHRRHGMSQRRIAELAGFAASEIHEIIKGRKVMAYDVLRRIADGLGVPHGYMGLASTTAPTTGTQVPPAFKPTSLDDPHERQQFVTALAGFAVGGTPPGFEQWLPQMGPWPGPTPESVTPATVHSVREITDRHRHLDATYGGGSCRDSAVGYLTWARCLLLSECRGETLNAELRRELADLHNLVGWMCHDLGEHAEARRYLAQGLVFAQQAGDSSLMADAYYRLGRVSIHQNDPREALHLFQLGQIVAQNSGSQASVAILHANIGWAHARMGNAMAVRDSLARAVDEFGRADAGRAPEWTRFFGHADLDGMRGLVYAALARHDEHRQEYAQSAVDHANMALQRRTTPCRSGSFDHITAAVGHALRGEGSEVVTHGRAVLSAADHVRSRRMLDRLSSVADVAEPLSRSHSELRDVVHDIRALVTA